MRLIQHGDRLPQDVRVNLHPQGTTAASTAGYDLFCLHSSVLHRFNYLTPTVGYRFQERAIEVRPGMPEIETPKTAATGWIAMGGA